MNKQEAAQFLGVSVRTLEDYTTKGRITCDYVKGKTRPVADYKPADLERLKAEIDAPIARAVVSPQNSAGDPEETRNGKPAEPHGKELARLRDIAGGDSGRLLVIAPEHLADLARALVETTQNQTAQNPAAVPITAKLMLTIDEAAALAGLSRGILRAAIQAGELSARIIGRGYKINRAALERWALSLTGSNEGAGEGRG